jgi:hypothetical protein
LTLNIHFGLLKYISNAQNRGRIIGKYNECIAHINAQKRRPKKTGTVKVYLIKDIVSGLSSSYSEEEASSSLF